MRALDLGPIKERLRAAETLCESAAFFGRNDRTYIDGTPWLPICCDPAREVPVLLLLVDPKGREVAEAEYITRSQEDMSALIAEVERLRREGA